MQSSSQLRPRIAFLTSVYDRAGVGGGTFVRYLRDAVESGQADITFFSADIGSQIDSYARRVEMPALVEASRSGWLKYAVYLDRAFRTEHAQQRFDLVWHNNALTSLFQSRDSLGIPVVGMINDYNNAESSTPLATRKKFGTGRALVRHFWHKLERRAARRLDLVVVNSRFMRSVIGQTYTLPEDKVRVLYKAVDLDQFQFTKRSFDGRPWKILFVKQDFVRGGLLDLLESLNEFPEPFHLTVVGPPALQHEHIRRAAQSNGIDSNLTLREYVPRDEMPTLMRNHDVLCIPSRSEALGVALLEGLASGTATIGSTAGGIPEVLDGGRAGWLAEPQNPDSIRQVLIDCMRGSEERQQRIEAGRRQVARFSVQTMIEEMNNIALSAMGRHDLCGGL